MIISGFHSIESVLIKRPELIQKLFLVSSENKRSLKILHLANNSGVSYETVDPKEIGSIAGNSKHQGFVAHISSISFLSEKDILPRLSKNKNSKVLILDSVQDPRNLGACLRSALAFDFDAVITNKDGSSPVNEHVFKTSVGAILSLNIFYVANLSRSIAILKEIGFWVLGFDGKGDTSIYSESFPSKTAVVLGSEGGGIRKLVKKNCDQLIKIPISKDVESLNISVATGIVLYEVQRQDAGVK